MAVVCGDGALLDRCCWGLELCVMAVVCCGWWSVGQVLLRSGTVCDGCCMLWMVVCWTGAVEVWNCVWWLLCVVDGCLLDRCCWGLEPCVMAVVCGGWCSVSQVLLRSGTACDGCCMRWMVLCWTGAVEVWNCVWWLLYAVDGCLLDRCCWGLEPCVMAVVCGGWCSVGQVLLRSGIVCDVCCGWWSVGQVLLKSGTVCDGWCMRWMVVCWTGAFEVWNHAWWLLYAVDGA